MEAGGFPLSDAAQLRAGGFSCAEVRRRRSRGDLGEIWARSRGDLGEIWARSGGDTGEIQGRYRGDTGEI